jgi:hypothetical protein
MYENVKRGYYQVGEKEMYFRSEWEAHFAMYLEWLLQNKQIKSWEFEPEFYEFPIRHGTTRYLPDFRVIELNDTVTVYEVKGRMTGKDRTKLKYMAKYYPEVRMVLVDKPYYTDIKTKLGRMLGIK